MRMSAQARRFLFMVDLFPVEHLPFRDNFRLHGFLNTSQG